MELKLFEKISKEVFPHASHLFLSCGSEPWTAKHFPEILSIVSKAKIPFVGFTTNGLLLSEDISRMVIGSDVKELEISFDGATESTFAKIRGGSSIRRVIGNVELLNKLKESLSTSLPEIVFHVTLMLSNIREISRIIKIAHDLKVPRVVGLHLHANPMLGIDEESLYYHRNLYDECIGPARKMANELGIDFFAPPLFGGNENCGQSGNTASIQSAVCTFPWTMMRISPDGDAFPCATWLGSEPIGNLNREHFFDIWYGREYRRLREEMRSNNLPEACRLCSTAIRRGDSFPLSSSK